MKKQFFHWHHKVLRAIVRITNEKSIRVPVLAALVIVAYAVGSLAVTISRKVETVPAAQVTVDDAISVDGYFIRGEKVIKVNNAKTSEYNYSDGDKVAKDAPLVTIYRNEESLKKSQELEEIREQIRQLKSLKNNSYVTNTSQIDQKITSEINSIGDAVDSGAYDQLSSHIHQLRTYALQSGSMNGDMSDITSRLKKLRSQRKSLKRQLKNQTSTISSKYSGYFSQTVDGYEKIFTLDCIDDLTVTSLKKLADKQVNADDSSNCKIVNEYMWYYAAVLSKSDASRLKENQEVTLRFSQPSDNVSATVYAIREDSEAGEVLVLFRSYDMNSDLISKRKEVGSVVLETYTGLKVSTEAIRVNDDGEAGVYIERNNISSFKVIDPLYKTSEYYIVKQEVIGDDSLVVGDKIIKRAKDIEDKKVVK